MFVDITTFFENYTPVGDILVMATVIVFLILIRTAYISRNREMHIFKLLLALLFVAAAININFNIILANPTESNIWIIYVLKWLYQFCLFFALYLFLMYMNDPLHQGGRMDKKIFWIATSLLIGVTILDILGTLTKFSFYIDDNLEIHKGINVFPIGYVVFIIILMYMVISFRNKIYRPVLIGIIATCIVSFMIMYVQAFFGQTSFTTSTYLFPTYAVLYFLHASAVDIEMGSARVDDFKDLIDSATAHGKKFFLISLYLRDFDDVGKKYPREIADKIREYSFRYCKGSKIFQISGGRTILTAPIDKNPGHSDLMKKMINTFYSEYQMYHLDYKMVITDSIDEINRNNDYIGLLQYIEKRMPDNDVHFIVEKEVDAYREHKYIIDQLADINEKKDLTDPRVLVFCQPVYNIETGKFDTAEALMRMRLDRIGMVFPDRFIPIAETHNYIHMLSMIILNKTCEQIRRLIEEGFYVKRISVNFSMLDVKEDHFCFNVKQIVQDTGIPFDKVAIEITESQNEKDFMVVKEKLNELRQNGITFYLDDFGTGYSNFERIMELPFDIIKFDRSLVIASSEDNNSKTMVTHLARMFTDMSYTVLYEGIENENDEERCKEMCARYLQGYKYSKPIPIEQLSGFLEKAGEKG